MNRGFGDGMSRAFELIAAPAVFAGAGHLLDRWLGTSPVFMVALGLFGVVGMFVNVWFGYDAEMRELESRGVWNRARPAPADEPVADLWSTRKRSTGGAGT